MAYAVEKGPQRFAGTGGVIVVHLTLAYLIVFGFSAPDILPPLNPPFEGTQIPIPPVPTPTPEPKTPNNKTQQDDPIEVPQSTTSLPTDNTTDVAVIDDWPGPTIDPGPRTPVGGNTGGVTVDPPLLTPKLAKPINDVLRWVTTIDYPRTALHRGEQGTTRFSVSVDARGKATECTITRSSGSAALDQATCKNVLRRAKFEPATDKYGVKVPGTYSNSVSWVLPE
jgi:protein TonB